VNTTALNTTGNQTCIRRSASPRPLRTIPRIIGKNPAIGKSRENRHRKWMDGWFGDRVGRHPSSQAARVPRGEGS
jgi:hypothetical protein